MFNYAKYTQELTKEELENLVEKPIGVLKITRRVVECLTSAGINTVKELLDTPLKTTRNLDCMGRNPERLIEAALDMYFKLYLDKRERKGKS